ncbi:MAG: SPOR domain-containing protein [Gammaproteobacteria bacterium]
MRKKTSPRRSRPVPGWAWLLAGLTIGLSIAYFTSPRDRTKHAPAPPLGGGQAPAAANREHAAVLAKPADKQSKQHFDFYTILPEMEVVVPDVRDNKGQTAPVDKPGTYILQAGSFRSFSEADSLKAQMALLGVEAKIDTVTVNNTDTWHRVRVGPYQDLRELNKIRTRLLNNNINGILLKINR